MGYKKFNEFKNVDEEMAAMFPVEPDFPVLEEHELDAFGEWISAFKVEKQLEVPRPMTVHPIDMRAAMEDYGATRRGSIIMEADHMNPNGRPVYKVTKYQQFWDKFEQWSKRNEKRAFAKVKDLQGYQEMADSMSV